MAYASVGLAALHVAHKAWGKAPSYLFQVGKGLRALTYGRLALFCVYVCVLISTPVTLCVYMFALVYSAHNAILTRVCLVDTE